MAIIINPEISGQECNDSITYSYLFEPLRINVQETDITATKLYVEIERYNILDKTIRIPFEDGSNSLLKYVELDLILGRPVSFDLSEVMLQLHQAGVFKIATIADIELSYEQTIVSKYIYHFIFTTDTVSAPVIVKKLPILGGRSFQQFSSTVPYTQVLTEFDYYGISKEDLAKRWANYMFYSTSLKNPTLVDNLQPNITLIPQIGSEFPNGGVLYWKSRFGGWMFWGFDIESRGSSGKYIGDLQVAMFESTKAINGDPYIPVDYISVQSEYTVDLKSIGLSNKELLAVSGIDSATAIYYAADNSGKLELMRLGTSSSPYKSLAAGGDFSVSLKSISNTSQKTA